MIPAQAGAPRLVPPTFSHDPCGVFASLRPSRRGEIDFHPGIRVGVESDVGRAPLAGRLDGLLIGRLGLELAAPPPLSSQAVSLP